MTAIDESQARTCHVMDMALRAFGQDGVRTAMLPEDGAAGLTAILSAQALLVPAAAVADPAGRRALIAHALAHLRHSPPAQPSAGLKPMTIAVMSLLEDARAERLLGAEFPGLGQVLTRAVFRGDPDPGLDFSSLALRLARALATPDYRDGNYWVNKGREAFESIWSASCASAAFRALGSMLANDLGQMRVRYDPDQYRRPAHRDDDAFLWDHAAQAREEQALAAPGDSDAGGAPKGKENRDREPIPAEPEWAERAFQYPEWHYRLQRLRADWCRVNERSVPRAGVPGRAVVHAPVRMMSLPRASRLDRGQRRRRLWEGEEVDLNAAIEAAVERRVGRTPEPRVFMRAGQQARQASVLVLLDLSASSNDAGKDGRSLLHLEKQAALLLAAAAAPAGHRVAVHGFSSNTRHDVRYSRMLDFGQPLDAVGVGRIGAARAAFSTRMGAALRHAAHCLRGEPGERRSVLLVTDGAPSDIDVHDVSHLVEDARAAVAQARREGVRCFCLAVDGQADAYVRRIFGPRNYDILNDAASLPSRLARAFARMLA